MYVSQQGLINTILTKTPVGMEVTGDTESHAGIAKAINAADLIVTTVSGLSKTKRAKHWRFLLRGGLFPFPLRDSRNRPGRSSLGLTLKTRDTAREMGFSDQERQNECAIIEQTGFGHDR